MDISFQIDQKSGIPIYIQIMNQIKHLIATGSLQAGQQLPTIREMAVGLKINLHTVAHAYAELEREGFLTIKRGRGTFITNGYQEHDLETLREHKLKTLVESMFAESLSLGYDPEEVQKALADHIEKWQQKTTQSTNSNQSE